MDGLLTSNHPLAALRMTILEKTNNPENNESSVLWGLSLFPGSAPGQWKDSLTAISLYVGFPPLVCNIIYLRNQILLTALPGSV